MKVAIIGGVAGGATAAARLRRLDESAEIIIFERSGYVSYANCGLPYYIGGDIKRRSSLTLQTPKSFKERFNIDVRVNSEVIKIDRARKKVTVKYAGGTYEESYDKLIYSPGARPILPDGTERGNFFPLRTVEDTFAIDDFIRGRSPKSAIVAGGGFIGLEAAENLVNRGISVTLIQGGPQVLPQTDYDIACFLHAELRRKGIKLVLSSRVTALEGDEGGVKVVTTSGGYRADFAIVALGVAPDTSLAEECGLQLGIKKAVVVDGHMRTSDPDIYAVGDAVREHAQILFACRRHPFINGRFLDHVVEIKAHFPAAVGELVERACGKNVGLLTAPSRKVRPAAFFKRCLCRRVHHAEVARTRKVCRDHAQNVHAMLRRASHRLQSNRYLVGAHARYFNIELSKRRRRGKNTSGSRSRQQSAALQQNGHSYPIT